MSSETILRVVVTGASGFLGGHIVKDFLAQGHAVCSMIRPTSQADQLESLNGNHRIERGQLDDIHYLQRCLQDVDVVIHSAARVKEEGSRDQFIFENLTLTQNLLQTAKKAGVKTFIFISSPSALAELKDQINIDEHYAYPRHALNYYCETKALAEQYVLSQNDDTMACCALRPRCIWGPGDLSGPYRKLLGKLYEEKLFDVSKGKQVLSSMCYVGNATHACLLAAQSRNIGGKAYFITDEQAVDTWHYMDQVADFFGLPRKKKVKSMFVLTMIVKLIDLIWAIPMVKHRYPPPVSSYGLGLVQFSATFSHAAAKRDFHYEPIVSMQEGLERYASWIKQQGGIDHYLGRQ